MPSRLAWPVSIALHALILFALAEVSLPVADVERRFARDVIRFELRPRTVVMPSFAPEQPPATLEAIATPDLRRRAEPVPSSSEPIDLEPEARSAAEPTVEQTAGPAAEPSGERLRIDEDIQAPTAGAAPAVDFEVLRKDAVAAVIEQAARDAGYRQFSIEDLIDEPVAEAAERVPSVFDVESSGRSRRGALTPGTQRTALGRRIAELCNELTGGFGVSIFGFGASVCAKPGPRADAFGHLRPQYMESLPVCAEVDVVDAQLEAIEGAEGGLLLLPDEGEEDDVEPVIKCRLVPREERIDGARPDRQQ